MKKTSKTTFSERFHILCDEAGFVSGRGRATEVSRFFGVGITSARNWLMEDICPRNSTLLKIVTRLMKYRRLDAKHAEKQVILWLEKGETYVPSPFEGSSTTELHGQELRAVLMANPRLRPLLKHEALKSLCDTDENIVHLIESVLEKTIEESRAV